MQKEINVLDNPLVREDLNNIKSISNLINAKKVEIHFNIIIFKYIEHKNFDIFILKRAKFSVSVSNIFLFTKSKSFVINTS